MTELRCTPLPETFQAVQHYTGESSFVAVTGTSVCPTPAWSFQLERVTEPPPDLVVRLVETAPDGPIPEPVTEITYEEDLDVPSHPVEFVVVVNADLKIPVVQPG